MNQHSRLKSDHEAEQQQKVQEQAKQTEKVRVFDTAEDLLRADAAQTVVPPRIAERLGRSLEGLPKRTTSWWRRLLGS